MSARVEVVEGAVENGNVVVVYHEYLVGTVNEVLTVIVVLRREVVPFNLVDVDFGNPRVGVGTSNEHVVGVYVVGPEVDLFEVLHAPGSVAGLPLLLVRSQDVLGVVHMQKPVLKHAYQFLGLLVAAILMSFHCQK